MKKILFLCTGNTCRSQMAEGWTRKLKPDILEPYSAGVEPGKLDKRAVKAMADAGVDISRYKPKDVTSLSHIQFDYVVTLCDHANETCPVFLGKTVRLHKGFDDPPKLAQNIESEGGKMDCYRRVRDQIREFVESMPDSLNPV